MAIDSPPLPVHPRGPAGGTGTVVVLGGVASTVVLIGVGAGRDGGPEGTNGVGVVVVVVVGSGAGVVEVADGLSISVKICRGRWSRIPVGRGAGRDSVSVGETGTTVANTRLGAVTDVIGTRLSDVGVVDGGWLVGADPVRGPAGSVVEVAVDVVLAGCVEGAAMVVGLPNRATPPRPRRSSAAASPVNARGLFKAPCPLLLGW